MKEEREITEFAELLYNFREGMNIKSIKANIESFLLANHYRKLPQDIHLKLIEWEGKPAIEFDDGDVFYQSQTIADFLMHLSILMPNCELPDDIYIRKLYD